MSSAKKTTRERRLSRVSRAMPKAEPILIGLLLDLWDDAHKHYRNIARMVADDLTMSGRVDRPIAFIEAAAHGLPSGQTARVRRAYQSLIDQDVLAVIGPAIADNAISLRPLVEHTKVPTISNTATVHWPGEYCFAVQWGSSADEPYAMAEWLSAKGHRTVAVIIDTFAQSAEYLQHFRAACTRKSIKIVGEARIPMVPSQRQKDEALAAVASMRRLAPDALANVGGSMGIVGLAEAVNESGWNIPRVCNETFGFLRLNGSSDLAAGWVGTSVCDPDNPVLQAVSGRYMALFGKPPQPNILAALYDTVHAALEGVVLAPILNPDGVKQGLERVRMLPAAIGRENVLSFGPWDHRAVKGRDVVVMVQQEGDRIVRAM